MKKLFLTVFLLAAINAPLFAVAGPSQWSLAGVASWAQPLTASGTALPATATYAIGDLFALYGGAASTTFELYRLCASGTTGVWRNTGGDGSTGITNILDADDLPTVTGNAHKALALGTDTASLYWLDIVSALVGKTVNMAALSTTGNIAASGSLTITGSTSLTGTLQVDNNAYLGPYTFFNSGRVMSFEVNASDTIVNKPGLVLVSTYSLALGERVVLAGASSTQALGVSRAASSGGKVDMVIWGDIAVLVADSSDPINEGDWVITSDDTPGHVMRASVSGDLPLSVEEMQRRVGWAGFGGAFYNGTEAATYTYVYMKGTR